MDELFAYRQGLLSGLKGVITELAGIVSAMPAHSWQLSSMDGVHTPHYTLFHLQELEAQVFIPLCRRIVDQNVALLPIFDDIAWMSSHYDSEKPTQCILEEFTALRFQEIHWLQTLPQVSWSNSARHPWWGVHTLQWWVELQLDYSHQQLTTLAAFLTF
jgi:hypothetical protein